ncbi:hypothetical protein AWH62_05630 [Maricaulis sp. W15]|uniref:Uncharacterized protein DUF1036 n=1 Tax=Maricaulis maris TaxID=74318 RepID=A0A495D3V2_9PROT|nr:MULTISPECIES: DUF1036 domain-containing protein [Maricaulis]OLF75300.1 hypothetical protein AWH62_05630 [Maricaulis sp. W15]RKQ96587.1 uncharacterized protein DUF1036 [Maricaulis maris]
MIPVRTAFAALLAALGAFILPGHAAAQRDVLLNVCNDAGFSVAVAAAYRTSPTEDRTLRSWFLVEPGSCLEGAVNNVVGDMLDLHVMSGEWRWPARVGDAVYCTPANSTFALATTEPCRNEREPRNFVRLPISSSRYRGVGQVDYRVRCEALSGADADMCVGAPRDERGLAQIVRTLEVCHTGARPADTVVLVARPDGRYDVAARQIIAGGDCVDLYRGFPPGNLVMVGALGRRNEDGAALFCVPDMVEGPLVRGNGECGGDQSVNAEAHSFRANVSRFTAYLQ